MLASANGPISGHPEGINRPAYWDALKAQLAAKGIRVVALDQPTSCMMAAKINDEFTGRKFETINGIAARHARRVRLPR